MGFIHYTEVELADLQATEGFLREKIDYYKMNFPNSPEISDMEDALFVIFDLESDLVAEFETEEVE